MAQDAPAQAGVSRATTSPWSALRHPVFRYLWIATVVSNIGSWMYNAAAGWLMTSLQRDPFIVSLVQVANSLPLFILALPAGALTDVIDRRRFILALEILTTPFSGLFAALVTLHFLTPGILLLFLFLLAALGHSRRRCRDEQRRGQHQPRSGAGLGRLPDFKPRHRRAVLAGRLQQPRRDRCDSAMATSSKASRPLPPERLAGAIRVGWRYVRNNRHLRATLAQRKQSLARSKDARIHERTCSVRQRRSITRSGFR
jgi:hypothetical protein